MKEDEEEGFKVGIKRFLYHYQMRKLREEKGMSQNKLADMAGLPHVLVHEVECLKRLPNEAAAEAIADVLDVDTRWLFPQWISTVYNAASSVAREGLIVVTQQSLESREVLALVDSTPVEQSAEQSLLADKVQSFLDILPPREKKILELRFGINSDHAHTLDEVGTYFGVTKERIRQQEAKALKKLEKSREAIKIHTLLEGNETTPDEIVKEEQAYDKKLRMNTTYYEYNHRETT